MLSLPFTPSSILDSLWAPPVILEVQSLSPSTFLSHHNVGAALLGVVYYRMTRAAMVSNLPLRSVSFLLHFLPLCRLVWFPAVVRVSTLCFRAARILRIQRLRLSDPGGPILPHFLRFI